MITAPTEFSGLQVWLDGSDTTRLFQLSGGTTAVAANNDPVGYWGDKSGNNRHFTNIGGSATTRPTWVSSLSTVRFDGSNDYLSSFFNITYTAQTVFIVVTQRVGVKYARIYTQISSGSDSAVPNYIPCLVDGTVGNRFGSYHGSSDRSQVTTRSLGAFDVYTSWFSSAYSANFLNGSSGSSYGSALNVAVTLSRLGAGATTPSAYLNGDISEVIVYNRALTNNERADVEYYLTRKWNFLNSIPRQVYGIKNGLWSSTDTWSVSAEPSPWNFPLEADNACTNTFTITADSSTKVDTIRNSTLAPNISSGGSFVLANGVSLSANVVKAAASPFFTLTLLPAASATLIGNLFTDSTTILGSALSAYGDTSITIFGNLIKNAHNARLFSNSSSSSITIYGNLDNNGGDYECLNNVGNGIVNIVGDIYGGKAAFACGIRNSGVGATFNILGNVFGPRAAASSAFAINNVSSSTFNLTGNIFGGVTTDSAFTSNAGIVNVSGNIFASSTGPGTSFTSSGVITLQGNCTATNGSAALASSSTTTPLSVYGNIINAPNGRQAIYAPRYQVFPTGSAQYTRQASNGYDSYVDYWTSDATFTYPASSDVALGTTYSNSSLSGSMAVPSPSSVALGALVGISTGTASITLDNVLSQPIANLTTPNSIGARLKNITTSQALSAIANSLNFTN